MMPERAKRFSDGIVVGVRGSITRMILGRRPRIIVV